MADLTTREVRVNLEVNGKQAGQTLGDLKSEAALLKKELNGLTLGTVEFTKKSAELARVNEELLDVRKATKSVESAMRENVEAFTKFGVGAAAALNLVVNVFGKSETAAIAQEKAEKAVAIALSLRSVAEGVLQVRQIAGIAIAQTQLVMTNGLAVAQRVLNVVMSANPIFIIGAVIVGVVAGLAALYNKFELVRTVVDAMTKPLRLVIDGLSYLYNSVFPAAEESTQKIIKSTVDYKKAKEDLIIATEKHINSLENEINILKASGGSIDEIYQKEKALGELKLKQAELNLVSMQTELTVRQAMAKLFGGDTAALQKQIADQQNLIATSVTDLKVLQLDYYAAKKNASEDAAKSEKDNAEKEKKIVEDAVKAKQEAEQKEFEDSLSANNKYFADKLNALKQSLLDGKISEDQFNLDSQTIALQNAKEQLSIYSDYGQDVTQALGESLDLQLGVLQQNANEMSAIVDGALNQNAAAIDADKAANQQQVATARQTANTIINIYKQIQQQKLANLQSANAALKASDDKYYAGQIKALDDQKAKGLISEKDYQTKVDALKKAQAEGAANRDAKFAEDALKIKRRKFNIEKAENIAQSIMNGATAATKALAQLGVPLGPIAAAALGVLTAFQVGLIASQQPPSFAKGGRTGAGGARDASGRRVAGIVHDNEYVVPTHIMHANPDVINYLEAQRLRKFDVGGFTSADFAGINQSIAINGGSQPSGDFAAELRGMRNDLQNFGRELHATISYQEVRTGLNVGDKVVADSRL